MLRTRFSAYTTSGTRTVLRWRKSVGIPRQQLSRLADMVGLPGTGWGVRTEKADDSLEDLDGGVSSLVMIGWWRGGLSYRFKTLADYGAGLLVYGGGYTLDSTAAGETAECKVCLVRSAGNREDGVGVCTCCMTGVKWMLERS